MRRSKISIRSLTSSSFSLSSLIKSFRFFLFLSILLYFSSIYVILSSIAFSRCSKSNSRCLSFFSHCFKEEIFDLFISGFIDSFNCLYLCLFPFTFTPLLISIPVIFTSASIPSSLFNSLASISGLVNIFLYLSPDPLISFKNSLGFVFICACL